MAMDALAPSPAPASPPKAQTDLPKTQTGLPKAKIGNLEVSRLILGGNLLEHVAHCRDLDFVAVWPRPITPRPR